MLGSQGIVVKCTAAVFFPTVDWRFHDHLNEQDADIQFTKEIEENGKLPFLDCLVIRNNNELRTTVYRKPTHTDRLLDESSYNPTSHKATTIKTLTRRVQLVVFKIPLTERPQFKHLPKLAARAP